MKEDKKCNCNDTCTCGCQDGKECTCEDVKCNCGCEEKKECNCKEEKKGLFKDKGKKEKKKIE